MCRRGSDRGDRLGQIHLDRTGKQLQRTLAGAVDRVAEQRDSEMRAMDADLVGAAGGRLQFEPGQAIPMPENPPSRCRRLPRRSDDHAPASFRGDLRERGVDGAA